MEHALPPDREARLVLIGHIRKRAHHRDVENGAPGVADMATRVGSVCDKVRPGGGQVLSEAVATFGLILVIRLASRLAPAATAALVALYITAAYGFTASTSFANPAVTLARSLTDTFAGIAPESVPGFLLGQAAGTLLAVSVANWILRRGRPTP